MRRDRRGATTVRGAAGAGATASSPASAAVGAAAGAGAGVRFPAGSSGRPDDDGGDAATGAVGRTRTVLSIGSESSQNPRSWLYRASRRLEPCEALSPGRFFEPIAACVDWLLNCGSEIGKINK